MPKDQEQEALKVEERPVALETRTQSSNREQKQDVPSSSIKRRSRWVEQRL